MQPPSDIFRAGSPAKVVIELLGLLHNLPGNWMGKGFNMIARPARQGDPAKPVFFLELNGTQETLEFITIGGDIPNRGEIEPTALLHGVHYLQTIADCEDNSFIHKEPGLWLHVPPTAENPKETYVRHATIPHGNSLAAQTTFFTTVAGGPDIQPVNSLPFPQTDPIPPLNDVTHATITNPNYIGPYLNTPLPVDCMPKGLDAAKTIKDPTEVLRAQIAKQVADKAIVETVVIVISTTPLQGGGIVNIPFLTKNANAAQMDAIFWIERVKNPSKIRRRPIRNTCNCNMCSASSLTSTMSIGRTSRLRHWPRPRRASRPFVLCNPARRCRWPERTGGTDGCHLLDRKQFERRMDRRSFNTLRRCS